MNRIWSFLSHLPLKCSAPPAPSPPGPFPCRVFRQVVHRHLTLGDAQCLLAKAGGQGDLGLHLKALGGTTLQQGKGGLSAWGSGLRAPQHLEPQPSQHPPGRAKPLSVPLCTIHFSLCRAHPQAQAFCQRACEWEQLLPRGLISPRRSHNEERAPGSCNLQGPSHLITIITTTIDKPRFTPVCTKHVTHISSCDSPNSSGT